MRILVIPVAGKLVKDPFGHAIPEDGRYYSPGPYWLRLQKRGAIKITEPGSVPETQPKKRGKS